MPRAWSTFSRPAAPTTIVRSICSIRSACRSGPEIKAADFAKALDDEPVAIIPFDPQLFGTAANNGQMIAEVSAKHPTTEIFSHLAQLMTGRAEAKKQKSGILTPLLRKLRKQS